MVPTKSSLLTTIPILLLMTITSFSAKGQSDSIPLQHVIIKDEWLEFYLMKFTKQIKGDSNHFIYINFYLDQQDQGHVYHLSETNYSKGESSYLVPTWGLWQNRMLIFSGKADLRPVCSISDSTTFTNLLRYSKRKLLPGTVHEPGSKTERLAYIPYSGIAYTFKVSKGGLDYFYDNLGNDTRASVPESLPAVPKPK